MILKTTFSILLVAFQSTLFAQFIESFDDGDITSNPSWDGNTELFVVESGLLRSNNDPDQGGSNSYYLSTESVVSYDATWEYYIDLQFATSGANYVDVFLMADNSDLLQVQNGYYVRLGGTQDEIVLFRLQGGTSTAIIDNSEGIINSSSSNEFKIRVSRDPSNVWQLEIDDGALDSYVIAGSEVDNSITTSNFFGIFIQQSSANSAVYSHFFDDFTVTGSITPDVLPPTIDSVIVSQSQLNIFFSEDVEELSAETIENYAVNNNISILSADRDPGDMSLVNLTTSGFLNGQSYKLNVIGINDLSGNSIDPEEIDFEYLVVSQPSFRDVVINEFMSDPSPSKGLPESDFVELYNPTENFFDLTGWRIGDNSNTSELLNSYVLRPDSYLIVCDESSVSDFQVYGDVIGVQSFPNFNATSADSVVLNDNSGLRIDAVGYDSPGNDGMTLEQVNPMAVCSDITNFLISSEPEGGTPGSINSVFNVEPDQNGPQLIRFEVVDPDSLILEFSEPIDESSLSSGSFSIQEIDDLSAQLVFQRFVSLSLVEGLISENDFTIVMDEIADCSGNLVSDDFEFYYDVTGPELLEIKVLSDSELALIFNEEVMENSAEDESSYSIESQQIKSSGGAQLQDSARNRVHIELVTNLVESSYLLNTIGIEDTLGNRRDTVSYFFDFKDQVDSAILVAPDILRVVFDVQPDPEKLSVINFSVDGETPDDVINETENGSLRLIFEENFDDNELYELYMEDLVDINGARMITPAQGFILDTKPPEIENLEVLDDNSIVLEFNEALSILPAVHLNNYELDGEIPTEAIFLNSKFVQLNFFQSFPIEEQMELIVRNIEDIHSNSMRSSSKLFLTYDPVAPRLDSAFYFGGDRIRLLISEKLDLSSLEIENLHFSDFQPVEFQIYGPDSTMLDLIMDTIPLTESGVLSIGNWSDQNGNSLDGTIEKTISTQSLVLSQVTTTSNTTLDLTFSHPLFGKDPFSATAYQIEGLQVLSVDIVANKIRLTTSEMVDGEHYHLKIDSELKSDNNYPLVHDMIEFQFEDYFESYNIVDSTTLRLVCSTEFELISNENFIFEPAIEITKIDADDNRILTLIFREALQENTSLELEWSGLVDRWGRRIPDNKMQFELDTQPPVISEILSDYSHQIIVIFNETVDQTTANSTNQYEIIGIGQAKLVEFIDDTSIRLAFGNVPEQVDLELRFQNISDTRGNYNLDDTIAFQYTPPPIPNPGEIMISEIMADPSPMIGLPEYEYVEIFNSSPNNYDLRSLVIADANDTITLPEIVLDAWSYLSLSKGSIDESENHYNIKDFISLTNSGEVISIINIKGELIDEVNYTLDWYKDSDKDDGGFSLELINPESDCPSPSNWTASEDPSGGTPGRENSVFSLDPDSIRPSLFSMEFDGNTIVLTFNEVMDEASLWSGQYETIGLDLEVLSVTAESVELIMNQDVQKGICYELEVSGVKDCSGNEIDPFFIDFGIGDVPGFNDIIVTEIMSDPEPQVSLPNSEYLEIFNASDRLLSLDQLYISDNQSRSGNLYGLLRPGQYLLLVPSSGLEKYSIENVISVPSWVSLDNDGEFIGLFYEDHPIFTITYSNEWYDDPELGAGGYALEMGDLNSPCAGYPNWQVTSSEIGGTPGYENAFSMEYPDNFGPVLENVDIVSSDSLLLVFDEKIDPDFEAQLEFSPGLQIDSMYYNLTDPNSIPVKLRSEIPQSEPIVITIEGVVDCNGNPSNSQQFEFVRHETPKSDLYISEILFDPVPGVEDFIELFNSSDSYLTLSGSALSGFRDTVILTSDIIIEPNQYLVVTTAKEALVFDYPDAIEDQILEVERLPSMPNDQGILVVKNPEGKTIDSAYYEDDFHSSLLAETEGVSLERISFSQPSISENNWNSASSLEGFATPGYANSQTISDVGSASTIEIEPKVFIPGSANPAYSSFTTINFDLGKAGLFANVDIYDQTGSFVISLLRGGSLSTSGFLKWDGTNSSGKKVRIGHYIIVFEIFGQKGEQATYKEVVVVGTEF